MNLLKEGIEKKAVIKTEQKRKLTIDGLTEVYPVYKVKLDVLFYNDKNDRIATWISKYKAEHDGKTPDLADREKYNNIIEEFIVESNPDAINKTQTNIKTVGQREAGVVLSDGRVIDGNRRFTCLRRLTQEDDKFSYFETVIIDRNIEDSAKQIKILELSIQHGEEQKVNYQPVDRLVGIYNDIISTKMISIAEYAKSTNESESEVNKRVGLAKLMIEFLEFINAPNQFYIARDLEVYYPLEELFKLIKKCSSDDEIEDLKIAVFANILMKTKGDITRYVRNFKPIIESEYKDDFLEEQKEIAEDIINALSEKDVIDTKVIRENIRSNESVIDRLDASADKALTKVRKNETKNKPIKLTEKATEYLESIDINILRKMNDSELRRLERQINKLEKVIEQIRESL